MSFNIIGTGSSLPEYVLTNEKLSEMVETSDEWITSRTGIKERHICTNETMTDLVTEASKRALEAAGLSPTSLDYIIVSTVEGDYKTPSLSCLLQAALGAKCPALDINAACSGFIYGLDLADSMFKSGKAEHILFVCAEEMTRHTDWTDRASCVLFGDGAAACVLKNGDGMLACKLTSSGNADVLKIGISSGTSPFAKKAFDTSLFYMNGQEVFKFAVNAMVNDIKDVLKDAGLTIDEVDMVVPHQANIRIIETAKQKLGTEKIACQIQDIGNMSSVTIPLVLDNLMRDGSIKKGDTVVFAAFGGGLTSGACVVKI